MNLHILRKDLAAALEQSGLNQFEFSAKYGLSYSWINKFLNGAADNPRLSSINELEAAIKKSKKEERASA